MKCRKFDLGRGRRSLSLPKGSPRFLDLLNFFRQQDLPPFSEGCIEIAVVCPFSILIPHFLAAMKFRFL